MSLKNLGLAVGVLAITSTALAQKKNTTSANMERMAANKAIQKKDMESAKSKLLSAKEYIDKSKVHEDTKNDQKTLWLVGDIYSSLASLAMQTQDVELLTSLGDNVLEESVDALEKAYPMGKKYREEIELTVNMNRFQMEQAASMLYKNNMFAEAAEIYMTQAKFRDCINILDTLALYNAAICYDKVEKYEKAAEIYEKVAKTGYNGTSCYVLASIAYRKAGMTDEATTLIAGAREKYPTDRELLLETVNTHLAAGNNAEAEKALADAIATDPENKQLHYTIGTIMIELEKNEEAEAALNRALEIDPDYVDAQYQLGAHLVTWAQSLKTTASKLGPNENAKYKELDTKMNETYKRALIPLEKYIKAYPNDKTVLTILFQIHRSLGDSAKALEYKKRADAAE